MKIYSGPLCIYGHACRIVMQEKTIEHETVYVKPGEMVERLAEPAKLVRYKIGVWVMIFMGVLVFLTYATKKEYWRDVH